MDPRSGASEQPAPSALAHQAASAAASLTAALRLRPRDRAEVTGAAPELWEQNQGAAGEPATPTSWVRWTFEEGRPTDLRVGWGGANGARAGSATGGSSRDVPAPPPLAEVVPREDGDGHCLSLRPGSDVGASVHTPPFPVQPGSEVEVRWSARTAGLPPPEGPDMRRGTVEALYYRIPPEERDPERHLNIKGRWPPRRVKPGSVPTSRTGTTQWQEHSERFVTPAEATHVELWFDHTRTAKPTGTGPAPGTLFLDDVEIIAEVPPTWLHFADRDSAGPAPPLAFRPAVPDEDVGLQWRDALHLPAGSSWRTRFRVEQGRDLLLAAAPVPIPKPHQAGPVAVRAVLRGRFGERVLIDRTLRPGPKSMDRHWRDLRVPLDDVVGDEVELELSAEAPEPVEANGCTASGPGTNSAANGGRVGSGPDDPPPSDAAWMVPSLVPARDDGRLVVLVLIDTLALGHTNLGTYARETTPFLKALADRAVRFDRVTATAPWTVPSVASLWTGQDALHHRAGLRQWHDRQRPRALPGAATTLAELLRDAGFQTAAFVDNPYLDPAFGLTQGFETLHRAIHPVQTGTGAQRVDAALRWLSRHRTGDRFVVVHLMDCHIPYHPPFRFARRWNGLFNRDPFAGALLGDDFLELTKVGLHTVDAPTRERITGLYDGGVRYVDSLVERLRAAAADFVGEDRLTFVVTADHGEELFDHGGMDHGHTMYGELLDVPLIIEDDRLPRGRRVTIPASQVDLAPTLVDLLGLPAPVDVHGISLLPWVADPARPAPARTLVSAAPLYGPFRIALTEGSTKVIHTMTRSDGGRRGRAKPKTFEWFDRTVDPREGASTFDTLPEASRRAAFDRVEAAASRLFDEVDVLVLDGGVTERHFQGTLTLPSGGTWEPGAYDLVAPGPGGDSGVAELIVRGDTVRFDVWSRRVVVGVRAAGARGADVAALARLRLTVDGQEWEPASGGGELQGEARTATAPATERSREGDRGALPVGVSVSWRPRRAEGVERPGATQAPSPALDEQLRALGYVE